MDSGFVGIVTIAYCPRLNEEWWLPNFRYAKK